MSYYKMAAVQRRKYLLMTSCLVLIGLSGWLAANGWLDRFDEWLLGPVFARGRPARPVHDRATGRTACWADGVTKQ